MGGFPGLEVKIRKYFSMLPRAHSGSEEEIFASRPVSVLRPVPVRHFFNRSTCDKIFPVKARFHALISGRVQGVAFRFFAQHVANQLGITGWVRNLYDGRVEVVAEGDREALELFLAELKKGPRMARVEKVDLDWEEFRDEFLDFSIKFSGY
jgi:acylphosphatase